MQLTDQQQTAEKEWARHPAFAENVVTVQPNPLRVFADVPAEQRGSVELPLHELVVPVCHWAGTWMDWADNEVVFGWSTARWHNHIETEGGFLLVPRPSWGPTEAEFVRCPIRSCVTHHDGHWIDTVADMDPAVLNEYGLPRLVAEWINAGNRAVNRIIDDHVLFIA